MQEGTIRCKACLRANKDSNDVREETPSWGKQSCIQEPILGNIPGVREPGDLPLSGGVGSSPLCSNIARRFFTWLIVRIYERET